MKVKNNKIIVKYSDSDYRLKDVIKSILENSFDLNFEDFPVILKKIGITYEEYDIEDYFYRENHFDFNITVDNEVVAIISLIPGNMIVPYGKVKVTTSDRREVFYISKVIEVQSEEKFLEEYKEFIKDHKDEWKKLYEEIMKY